MIRFATGCSALLLASSLAFADSGDTDSGDTDSGSGVATGAAQVAGDEGGAAACGCATGVPGAPMAMVLAGLVLVRIRSAGRGSSASRTA